VDCASVSSSIRTDSIQDGVDPSEEVCPDWIMPETSFREGLPVPTKIKDHQSGDLESSDRGYGLIEPYNLRLLGESSGIRVEAPECWPSWLDPPIIGCPSMSP